VNDLSVRSHYSSPNLDHQYGIDFFNNMTILPGKQFVSRYDDIELRVYSKRPTSYLMICSDIKKSPTLGDGMCKSCQKVLRKKWQQFTQQPYSNDWKSNGESCFFGICHLAFQ
jgi:hypothetical protein